ncbi:O-methyltransferase family protein [Prunus dulcis]|uniref:O-methyltransferase family protein n=1 Tax=Prunus dulcis TaxID=3755 RepID=A0A4Y1QUN2_PRUDU|nr:O-methyltransferase family protein [Prunus dulcis]
MEIKRREETNAHKYHGSLNPEPLDPLCLCQLPLTQLRWYAEQLACDLLVMAEKYQVHHLKDLCQKFLVSNLNWDNSLSTYTFVHQHNAKQIINLALTLITDNMNKLTTGEEYAELKKKDPRLVFEIYEACKTICFLRCGIICFQTSNNISFLPYKLPTKASSQVLHFCK